MTNSLVSEANRLAAPHGGELVNLLVEPGRSAELDAEASNLPQWVLTPRQLCDIEQIFDRRVFTA